MRPLRRVLPIALPALLLLPLAIAEPVFPGAQKLELTVSENGTIRGVVTHDYSDDDWLRTYSLTITWSRLGVYDLVRMDGVDAFVGTGEASLSAAGSLEVSLSDQGTDSVLRCTVEVSRAAPSQAFLAQVDGRLVGGAGEGIVDDDAWVCDDSEVSGTTHGGVGDVVVAGSAVEGAERLASATFPAEVAVLLGFADSAQAWDEEDPAEFMHELVSAGYFEAQAEMGEQILPFSRTYAAEGNVVGHLVCPEMGVTDTPSTSGECTIASATTIEVARVGGTSAAPRAAVEAASGEETPAATDVEAKDTPAAATLAAAAGLALAAFALRRRG